ncbi:hypothetical protein HELRODRAFT_64985, partial [Helobdella robusta]|uniref:Impact N-terminal domain-containing protein n=1 Tax=Helobdella robusta TaxID=6412 RepID=T1FY22_HELRO
KSEIISSVLPTIHHGQSIIDRKSEFQGHLASICHQKQVQMVVNKLKENNKINSAKHNIVAYRLETGNGKVIGDSFDDGEHQAGGQDASLNIIIFSRWTRETWWWWLFGNILLGPDRFKHINSCTRDILEEHGYLQHKVWFFFSYMFIYVRNKKNYKC